LLFYTFRIAPHDPPGMVVPQHKKQTKPHEKTYRHDKNVPDVGLTHNVIGSLRRRRGNPVFPLAAFLDCFAALAMTKVMRKP
jgi:hypothetical protein